MGAPPSMSRASTWFLPGDPPPHLVERFHVQLREATRTTSRWMGAVVLGAFLAWGGFDLLLEPAHAAAFVAVRLAFAVLILLSWIWLGSRRARGTAIEVAAFAMFASVQVPIAWMVPRVEDSLEPYLLGFSLSLYASAFVIVCHWRITAWLVGLTWIAFAASVASAPMSRNDMVTCVYYLLTACVLAMLGQVFRYRLGWQAHVTKDALERAQEDNAALVARLECLSRQDPLTLLANRRSWAEALDQAFAHARRHGTALTVVLLDLDHLKHINDTHGHAVGDAVLRRTAELLHGSSRAGDLVARLGGDEFAILCPDASAGEGEQVARRLLHEVARSATPGLPMVTLSAGVAELRADDLDPEAVVARADRALYRAKSRRGAVSTGGEGAPVH